MKVICIDTTTPNLYGLPPLELKEGETYTVIGERINVLSGIENYVLAECILGYGKFRFIPLSDIDETELVNQREEQCIS